MDNALAIVVADLHFRNKDQVWGDRPEIRGDAQYAVEQIEQIMTTHRPQYLLLAGDNFDAKLHRSDSLSLMARLLEAARQRNVRVVYVEGQHEKAEPSILQALDSTTIHLNRTQMQLGPWQLYGLDILSPSDAKLAFNQIPPGTDILLTHQVWKDFLGERFGQLWMRDLPNMRLMITGDFHKMSLQSREGQAGPQQVLSPGPVVMQEITEDPQKYVFRLSQDLTLTELPLQGRGFAAFMALAEESIAQIISTTRAHMANEPYVNLPENLRKPLVHITYPSNRPNYRAQLELALQDIVHLFFRVSMVQAGTVAPDRAQRERMVAGGLPTIIRENYNEDPEAASLAIRLAESKDPEEEVERVYNELLLQDLPDAQQPTAA